MSLIQEALSKTQSSVSPHPKKVSRPSREKPRKTRIGGLQDFDHEVEKKIQQVQAPQQPGIVVEKKSSFLPILLLVFVGPLLAFGVSYWLNQPPASDNELPLVVDIPKADFKSKPELSVLTRTSQGVLSKPTFKDIVRSFELSGIIFGGEESYALVNGHIMREGDTVQGDITVKSIQKQFIELESQGHIARIDLRL